MPSSVLVFQRLKTIFVPFLLFQFFLRRKRFLYFKRDIIIKSLSAYNTQLKFVSTERAHNSQDNGKKKRIPVATKNQFPLFKMKMFPSSLNTGNQPAFWYDCAVLVTCWPATCVWCMCFLCFSYGNIALLSPLIISFILSECSRFKCFVPFYISHFVHLCFLFNNSL